MNRSHLHPALCIPAILIAMIACVLPGQTIQPPSTMDPITIESAVAGTAQAAALQTQQANPVTATATVVPTDTPVHETVSAYGTSLMKRGDGSIQFKDYRAGVQIIFPPNWLAVRPGEPEYYDAWGEQGLQSQWFLEEIASLQNLDLNVFRVTAYDTHPEHILYNALPKINIVFQRGDPRTLKDVEADQKRAIRTSLMKGDKFLSADFQEMAGGLQTLLFQEQWVSSVENGKDITSHYKGTFFKVPTGLVAIDLVMHSDQKDVLAPEYDQILQSITLFTP